MLITGDGAAAEDLGELSRERIHRAPQALGKRELGLFSKNRTEANVAGASQRGKWLEREVAGARPPVIHSTLKNVADLGHRAPHH